MADTGRRYAAQAFGAWLRRLAGLFAVAGGFLLLAMIMLVIVSVVGRAVFSLPVPGDFEIVGIGTAISIFLFLPYCYLERGNVTVDLVLQRFPERVQRVMDSVAQLVVGLIAAVFAWRMVFGLVDTFRYEDISMIVGLPLWWAYPFAVVSFALLAVSALYTAVCGWEDEARE